MEFTRCEDCEYYLVSAEDEPCCDCEHCTGSNEHFIKIPAEIPVISDISDDEINHPARYAGGKYECIDVMTDVFGVDAVKSFCKLNAFKYLWREQNKNGVEDLQKASWYLDKLIELSDQN